MHLERGQGTKSEDSGRDPPQGQTLTVRRRHRCLTFCDHRLLVVPSAAVMGVFEDGDVFVGAWCGGGRALEVVALVVAGITAVVRFVHHMRQGVDGVREVAQPRLEQEGRSRCHGQVRQ
jgi:hypothetical protein